jgi:anti-anti-sigma factor
VDSPTQTLDATTESRPDGLVLAFRGELDISSVQRAEVGLQRAEVELQRAEEETGGGVPLVLDLRELKFMDSTGLRFILGAQTRSSRAGRRFMVVRGPEPVERVFRVTRVDSILEMVDDPALALAS